MVETLTIRSGVAKPAILPVAQPAPRAGRSAVRSPTGTPAAGGPDDDSNLGPRHGDAARLELSRIHPKASDRDQSSGDISELIHRLQEYLNMILSLLASNFDRTALKFADPQ